ncbi:hypothetical protein QH494_06605 [Sphingomonas sp. AR_OL41]|jgi:rRNA maturation endonuclease Nob1|uniref:hypothetical protein n=1 Tax=Sphingomonas sp. AR_OL41 TaxID=3042729 RepID=UPI002480373C|nr:hypothetical protein [Sphingomonas sp. AR_OL41]MDH7971850.1 hypothetical protein [Sphingomonas sp. AR_OL41]
MRSRRSPTQQQSGCAIGQHRPYRVISEPGTPEVERAICRDCGSDLLRTRATRRWLFSGMLG